MFQIKPIRKPKKDANNDFAFLNDSSGKNKSNKSKKQPATEADKLRQDAFAAGEFALQPAVLYFSKHIIEVFMIFSALCFVFYGFEFIIDRRVRNILESHLFRSAEKNVQDESIFQN